MVDLLIIIIGVCLLLYVLLGGSDYGAGILELWPSGDLRDKQKQVINRAMGPVWEANHMWLILVVVILFVGFPTIFTRIMVSLHLPMLALLGGIVVRGAAFTFRHYDAMQTPRSQRVYTRLFGLSSLGTALCLGLIAGSLHRGLMDPRATDFAEAYIAPWWGAFPLAVGIFVSAMFVFLACIFLIGETDDQRLINRFSSYGKRANAGVVLAGGGVFFASLSESQGLLVKFAGNLLAWGCIIVATGLFVALWWFVGRRQIRLMRVVAAGQVALILTGWYMLYVPDALTLTTGPLSFHDSAAPPATLRQLLWALGVGGVLIFPSLYFLFRVFKGGQRGVDDTEDRA